MAWNPNVPTVTNRVQDDLAAVRENFQHLDPLAPYIQALLSSRIVDHNLDVATPPNGWYMRWENGLQICMVQRLLLDFLNANHMFVDWTFPATFAAADYVPLALYNFDSGDADPYSVKSLQARNWSTTTVGIELLSSGVFGPSDIRYVSVLAIGRWK